MEGMNKYKDPESGQTEQKAVSGDHQQTGSADAIVLSEAEWNDAPGSPLAQTTGTEAFLDQIVAEENKTPALFHYISRWSFAAAILLFLGLSTLYLFYPANKQNTLPPAEPELAKALPPAGNRLAVVYNSGESAMRHLLPDGSAALISPHSQISYLPQFEPGKRDINLEGEAVFDVAKDASRPFTVYCKEVQTKALGTKFRVSMLTDSALVSVLLLEGKILVNSTAAAYKGQKYYLLPGNEIVYSRRDSRFTLNKRQLSTGPAIAIATPSNSASELKPDAKIRINADNKRIHFNDVGMARVLNIIATKYGVSIAYPTDQINDIRFVGTLNLEDPVQKILRDITSMNNLGLVYDSAGRKYTIR